ncbi:hypothetical protein EDB89DRAFT_1912636 [Lactarius sanguifluus]|nr:hypothetical protein EDB89DRAFT_1912636 [Lactarius sanguifluus]
MHLVRCCSCSLLRMQRSLGFTVKEMPGVAFAVGMPCGFAYPTFVPMAVCSPVNSPSCGTSGVILMAFWKDIRKTVSESPSGVTLLASGMAILAYSVNVMKLISLGHQSRDASSHRTTVDHLSESRYNYSASVLQYMATYLRTETFSDEINSKSYISQPSRPHTLGCQDFFLLLSIFLSAHMPRYRAFLYPAKLDGSWKHHYLQQSAPSASKYFHVITHVIATSA